MGKKELTRWEKFGKKVLAEMAKIIDERTGKPITITELAKRATYPGSKSGLTRVHLSRIINGDSGASDRTIEMIAHALGRKTDAEIDEVRRWAGYITEATPAEPPPELRHFRSLRLEFQQIIAQQVEVFYQLQEKEKRGQK